MNVFQLCLAFPAKQRLLIILWSPLPVTLSFPLHSLLPGLQANIPGCHHHALFWDFGLSSGTKGKGLGQLLLPAGHS